MNKADSFGASALAVFAVAASGCYSPATYTTPRTVEPGKVQHIVALDGRTETARTIDNNAAGKAPGVYPSYTARIGLAEPLDLGLRFPLGGDMKINFVRSRYFDAAIQPRVSWTPLLASDDSDGDSLYFVADSPLMLGINGKDVSVVLSGTPAFAHRTRNPWRKFIVATLGLDLRISRAFAIHPSMSLVRRIDGESSDAVTVFAGIGFGFGALPVFE